MRSTATSARRFGMHRPPRTGRARLASSPTTSSISWSSAACRRSARRSPPFQPTRSKPTQSCPWLSQAIACSTIFSTRPFPTLPRRGDLPPRFLPSASRLRPAVRHRERLAECAPGGSPRRGRRGARLRAAFEAQPADGLARGLVHRVVALDSLAVTELWGLRLDESRPRPGGGACVGSPDPAALPGGGVPRLAGYRRELAATYQCRSCSSSPSRRSR